MRTLVISANCLDAKAASKDEHCVTPLQSLEPHLKGRLAPFPPLVITEAANTTCREKKTADGNDYFGQCANAVARMEAKRFFTRHGASEGDGTITSHHLLIDYTCPYINWQLEKSHTGASRNNSLRVHPTHATS